MSSITNKFTRRNAFKCLFGAVPLSAAHAGEGIKERLDLQAMRTVNLRAALSVADFGLGSLDFDDLGPVRRRIVRLRDTKHEKGFIALTHVSLVAYTLPRESKAAEDTAVFVSRQKFPKWVEESSPGGTCQVWRLNETTPKKRDLYVGRINELERLSRVGPDLLGTLYLEPRRVSNIEIYDSAGTTWRQQIRDIDLLDKPDVVALRKVFDDLVDVKGI